MTKTSKTLSAAALLALLSACGSGTGLFNRDRPDEMAVSRNAPLVIPPDFGLTPPKAGTGETQTDVNRQALDAMFGGPAPRSPAETSALDQAGRAMAATGVRSEVGDAQTRVVDKGAVINDIIAAPEGDGQFARAVAGQ